MLKRKAHKEELIAGANATTCANASYWKGFPEVKKLCQNIMANANAQTAATATAATVTAVQLQQTNPAVMAQIQSNPALYQAVQTNPALLQQIQANPAIVNQIQANPALLQQYSTAVPTGSGVGIYNISYTDPNTGMYYPNAQDSSGNFNPTIYNQIMQDENSYQYQNAGQYNTASTSYGGALASNTFDTGAGITAATPPANKATGDEKKEGMATWEKAVIGAGVIGLAGAVWYFGFRKK